MRKLIIIFGLFLYGQVNATHIVGGGISYECVGPGRYVFTMEMYRDCIQGEAPFDETAAITIYVVPPNGRPYIFTTLYEQHGLITRIQDDPIDCIVYPPNICVEGTVYTTEVIDLPIQTSSSYVIAYQRCCRNNSITNLVNPGDLGTTYTIEILPEAQQLCNNSPVFNNYPPTIICNDIPLEFDHSATDSDGDQLVYEFCATFIGGGKAGSEGYDGEPTDPNGVSPDPATPPPYTPVPFITPTFSAMMPMLGNPIISIDPTTGLITGTPNLLGQFVVGVCVFEYRNGVLLSVTRRDFQFNVANCSPEVEAIIASDSIISDDDFFILSCGSNTVPLQNLSRQERYIQTYEWKFFNPNYNQQFTSKDVTLTLPDTGTYYGEMILNSGLFCSDTAKVTVRIAPAVHADFTYAYDTCNTTPVQFTDASYSDGSVPIVFREWDFMDGTLSNDIYPEHLFDMGGDSYDVMLFVRDLNGCESDTVRPIDWYPLPFSLSLAPINDYGCSPLSVGFDNLAYPLNDNYRYTWDFGDGGTSTAFSPLHVYEVPGTYDVSLSVVSPTGCADSVEALGLIQALVSPKAGFDYSPKSLTNFNATVTFTDESQLAQGWQWHMGNEAILYEQEPVYHFEDTGSVRITQIVARDNGCLDTAQAYLDIIPQVRYYLPNAFTPNEDDLNDGFVGVGFFEGMRDFRMTIWNRWGEMVFESRNPATAWNGRKMNTGQLSPQGVYVYIVHYVEPRGKPIQLKGFATLLL